MNGFFLEKLLKYLVERWSFAVEVKTKKVGRPISSPPPWGELFIKIGQQELANHLGVEKSTVGKWAREIHRIPKLAKRELKHLCERYKITNCTDIFDD